MSVLAACGLTMVVLLWNWRRSGWGLVDYLGIGLVWAYVRLWHRWSCNGQAPLPEVGPAILVANHTCSADPAFLTAGCRRRLSFLLAAEFYQAPLVPRLFEFIHCVPVTRSGKDARALRMSLSRLQQGLVLCIFPEGGLSNAGLKGPHVGKPGIAYIALKSGIPVYPALITKGPQTHEVLEGWLVPSRGVHVLFGQPIDLTHFRARPVNRRLLEDVTRFIMEQIAGLENNKDSQPVKEVHHGHGNIGVRTGEQALRAM